MEIRSKYFKFTTDKDLFAYFRTHYAHYFSPLTNLKQLIRQAANLNWQVKALFLFKNKRSGFVWFLYFLSIIVGLYGSLKVVFCLFGIEADACHSIVLWYGVNSFGLSWLKDWLFTQDN